MKTTKRQALKLAKTATLITMTDRDYPMIGKPISFDEMMENIRQFGQHWSAWLEHDTLSIDTLSKIHFEITPKSLND